MSRNLYPGDSVEVGNGTRHVTVEADGTSAEFKDGYDAYHVGVRRHENPFTHLGCYSGALDWERGWVRGNSETGSPAGV